MKKLIFLAFAVAPLLLTSSHIFAQEGQWTTYTRANSGLIGDSVTSIAFDGNGTPWVAARQGVAKYDGAGGWTFYNSQTYMPSNDIWDIDYTNGSLWFGHRSGLTAFNGAEWTTYTTTNSGLVNAPVLCLAHDFQNTLWIGTARGLSRLSQDKNWTTFTHENTPPIPYNGIQALTTDGASNLWIAFIATQGIVKFSGGDGASAIFLRQETIPGFPAQVKIMGLAVDRAANLWLATAKHGAVKINPTGATVYSKQTEFAIKDSNVHTIRVDQCANVWIGTDAGAAMYNGSVWIPISKSTGHLPNDTVNVIKVDAVGHVWFGTKGGVTVFKPLPKAPYLISPQMEMTVTSDSTVCKWSMVCPGIITYWYEIADNPAFTNSRIDTTSPSLMQARLLDTGLQNNTTYYWRVKAKNDAGWSPYSPTWIFHVSYPSGVEMGPMMNSRCELMQNYPNPCYERTTIGFSTRKHHAVCLTMYDVLGRQCAVLIDKQLGPGRYEVPVDVSGLPKGMYMYCLRAGSDVLYRTLHVNR